MHAMKWDGACLLSRDWFEVNARNIIQRIPCLVDEISCGVTNWIYLGAELEIIVEKCTSCRITANITHK